MKLGVEQLLLHVDRRTVKVIAARLLPAEVFQASLTRHNAPWQTRDPLEELFILAGPRTPPSLPGEAGGCG